MMFIERTNALGQVMSTGVHIGENLNAEWTHPREREESVWVQADGDELDTIKQRFDNIPMSSGRVVQWDGDIASFILMNLRWEVKR
jgi:hypothetical protein